MSEITFSAVCHYILIYSTSVQYSKKYRWIFFQNGIGKCNGKVEGVCPQILSSGLSGIFFGHHTGNLTMDYSRNVVITNGVLTFPKVK